LVIIVIGAAVRQAAQNATQIRCVACAELIRKEARICRYCRTEQPLLLTEEVGFRAQMRRHPVITAIVFLAFVVLMSALMPHSK